MADVVANLTIRAQGADQAAAALDTVNQGFQRVGQEHSGLVEKFAHRFSHIGLMIFAADAIRSSGLAAETRQIIGTLNMAIMAMSSLFGAASGPIMLVTSGLTVLIGIIATVSGHTDELNNKYSKHIEEAEKVAKKTDDVFLVFAKTRDVMREYAKEFGTLNGFAKDYAAAQDNAAKVTAANSIPAHQAIISKLMEEKAAIQEQIDAKKADIQSLSEWAFAGTKMAKDRTTLMNAELKKFEDGLAQVNGKIKQQEGDIVALGKGYASWEDYIKAITKAHEEERKASEEVTKKIKKQLQEEADAETERYQWAAKLREDDLKATEEAIKEQDKLDNAHYSALAAARSRDVKDHLVSMSKIEADEQTAADKRGRTHKLMYDTMRQYSDMFFRAQGDAFARMLVDGQSFTKSMENAFKDMARMFISMVEQMIVKWLIFQAMTGGMGGFGGGFLGFAEGGSFVADRPTPILVGEGGQSELVTITPFSKLGQTEGTGNKGGTTINIGTIQTDVHGIQDPTAIADKIGDQIIQRIRGRGELNFARAV